jgi:hypothetical protein
MSKTKAFLYSIFYLGIIVLGVYIGFSVYWSEHALQYFGIIAFIFVGFGSLYLAISFTRVIIPCKFNYNFKVLSNVVLYKDLKQKVGKKIHLINVTYVTLCFVFFLISSFFYKKIVREYELSQLKNHGKIQKVQIDKIDRLGKGSLYAFFKLNYDGQQYDLHLSQNNLNKGDSSLVIFSKERPRIIKWASEFK